MHPLLKDNPGEKMLMLGNEAIARGAIEEGVAFATAYPGAFFGGRGQGNGQIRI